MSSADEDEENCLEDEENNTLGKAVVDILEDDRNDALHTEVDLVNSASYLEFINSLPFGDRSENFASICLKQEKVMQSKHIKLNPFPRNPAPGEIKNKGHQLVF